MTTITPARRDSEPPPPALVQVTTLYHRRGVGEVTEFDCRASRPLKDEQSYRRQTTVGPHWEILGLGWVDGMCGWLAVKNMGPEGLPPDRVLSRSQTAARDCATLELGVQTGNAVECVAAVPYGLCLQLSPRVQWWVRAKDGRCKMDLLALPEVA